MTENEGQSKKRRRRRRGRGRGKGGQGQPQPQQPQSQTKDYDPYDLEAEKRQINAEKIVKAAENKSAEDLLDDLIPLILQARDMEVFNWMIKATGQSRVAIVTQILRGAIIKERSNHREAMGGGGASSKDSEALAARL